MITCNLIIPQALWSRKVRRSAAAAVHDFLGDQHRDVAGALRDHRDQPDRDFMPSASGACIYPTRWDWATLAGSFGLFFTLFYLFIRFLPMISIVEVRSLVHETEEEKSHA